jgi:uncharacterized membrane protein YdjX (TVP38/TMEM64 family)
LTARASRIMGGASVGALAAGLVLTLRALPLEPTLARVDESAGRGLVGMAAFGGAYVVAALLLVPGSAMTLAAGAVFGLVRGVAVVSAASTTAAALAFLVARHGGRRFVERAARRYRTFRAVDRAIAEGGWKVVGLLRLSPAMPFSVENYLFGLTAVRFWPYVLSSWAFMLPGTILYVALGRAGRAAAAGSHPTAEWLLLGAGLAATAAVTAQLTRLARRALARQDAVDAWSPDVGESPPAILPRWLPIVSILALAIGGWAHFNQAQLHSLAGPGPVFSEEAYAASTAGAPFDHSAFDALLARHVAEGGFVDYEGLRRDSAQLDGYLARLAAAPFERLSRDEKLALLVDAYNAFTLRLILDRWPIASIKDIPSGERWRARRWKLAGRVLSLDQLEQEEIRPRFREPRIHFALVCAARGCPPLRREVYVGSRIDEQLEDQARYVHTHDRWLRWDADHESVHLTELYKWYRTDFERDTGSVLAFVGRYSPPVQAALAAGRSPRVGFIPYDWSLNGKAGSDD